MAFMTLKIIVFRKIRKVYLFLSLFFVYFFPILISERLLTTLLVVEEGSIENLLFAKIWLYGLDSAFPQIFN